METHKERMDWLKKHDPITYYEMTSNPTGSDSDGSGGFIIAVIGLVCLGIYLLIK